MAKHIALKTATRYINGKTSVKIVQGLEYKTNSKEYKAFNDSFFIVKPRMPRGYSNEEFTVMKDIYMEFCNTNKTLEEYWEEYQVRLPESNAERPGVICYFCIIRGEDNQTHYKGFKNPAQALQNILFEEDPERFDGVKPDIEDKLDSILATIK